MTSADTHAQVVSQGRPRASDDYQGGRTLDKLAKKFIEDNTGTPSSSDTRSPAAIYLQKKTKKEQSFVTTLTEAT